jgi:hypothetical protein
MRHPFLTLAVIGFAAVHSSAAARAQAQTLLPSQLGMNGNGMNFGSFGTGMNNSGFVPGGQNMGGQAMSMNQYMAARMLQAAADNEPATAEEHEGHGNPAQSGRAQSQRQSSGGSSPRQSGRSRSRAKSESGRKDCAAASGQEIAGLSGNQLADAGAAHC